MGEVEIDVRSLCEPDVSGKQYPEWSVTAHSWQAAWRIVDDACYDRTLVVRHRLCDGWYRLELGHKSIS